MTRRRPTPEELELWHSVVISAEPLRTPRTAVAPKPKPAKLATVLQRLPLKSSDRRTTPITTPKYRSTTAVVQMDQKAFGRMKRGKLVPEGRIDLHGMTLERAHPVLAGFILREQAAGKRLVLVITGKGRSGSNSGPMSGPRGVLKRQVPFWLSMPPLSPLVLQVSPAHISHGGEGAFYVYLRKSR